MSPRTLDGALWEAEAAGWLGIANDGFYHAGQKLRINTGECMEEIRSRSLPQTRYG